jgi:hypothetical protein
MEGDELNSFGGLRPKTHELKVLATGGFKFSH